MAIWRSPLSAGAEGARGSYRNLSGKRTDFIFHGAFRVLSSFSYHRYPNGCGDFLFCSVNKKIIGGSLKNGQVLKGR
jgi:hypothetical protein